MIVAIGNGNQGCLGNWFNPHCQGNNKCLVLVSNVTHMLVAGSMVGFFNVRTMFSVSSVGMTMLSSLCCHGYDRY